MEKKKKCNKKSGLKPVAIMNADTGEVHMLKEPNPQGGIIVTIHPPRDIPDFLKDADIIELA